jgi:hypothetical protein
MHRIYIGDHGLVLYAHQVVQTGLAQGMNDFMGTVFFHSLLGPLVASILGVVGDLAGRGLAEISSQQRA